MNGRAHAPATSASLIRAKLEGSCLDVVDARALKVTEADQDKLAAWGFPRKIAMELPYFNSHGKPTGFSRFRYLEDTRDGFASKTEAKPLRYVQPPETMCDLYLPPLVDWQQIQKNPTLTVVITEGELKAACCTKLSYPCIGLGGVYSFKSTKKKVPLIPQFYEFDWKGRTVLVAFDSDAHTNPMVVAARNELCRELTMLGALPHVAELSPAEDGSKRGLDDIALQEGADGLQLALDAAEAFAPMAALHELNAEVAYVRDPGLVVVLETGQRLRPYDFTAHAYSNRVYYNITSKNGEPKMEQKKAAPAWLDWPQRFTLEKLVYEPGAERLHNSSFNTWPGWGVQPKRGRVAPWKWLLDHLFGDEHESRDWFERWCALPLQRPGTKLYTATVLWGVRTGTGKSLVGTTLSKIYGSNAVLIGDAQLQDARNEWAQNKQFVMGDDVTGHDQRKYADRLKAMITQHTMRIDPKYIPSYSVRDCINYFFTSNHPDAFFLEDDDRRFFVHEVQTAPADMQSYREYVDWLEHGGAEALFYYLLHLDLRDFTAESRAPSTISRALMVEDGLSDLGRWVRKLRDDPDSVLKIGGAQARGDLWTSTELLRLYDPESRGKATAGGLTRELKRAGLRLCYKGNPIKTAQGQVRLFAIRNPEQWFDERGPRIIEHYDASRSVTAAAPSQGKF